MRTALLAASAALALSLPAFAQDPAKPALAPSEIVAAAPKADWVAIPAEDLLVMTLAPDAEGKPRQVVIQLMPAPFSQGWVHNIRLFARSGWYDGISVNRVQDNYVTQWGDPNYDNPEATGTPKPLPEGLKVMEEAEYVSAVSALPRPEGPKLTDVLAACPKKKGRCNVSDLPADMQAVVAKITRRPVVKDTYSETGLFRDGWPLASTAPNVWPTHCYGMVGVGRNYSPDTGSGAELYTVIGHAPRHLDRNIALVGRVIEGMEHLSPLPRGSVRWVSTPPKKRTSARRS
jgi:Peptidyl-prolyl cis-trans isomerase (rotamase) - cyclophilin family